MEKVWDYKIVINGRLLKLEEEVKEMIAQGWQPLGGVAVESGEGGALFQAMVRRGEDI